MPPVASTKPLRRRQSGTDYVYHSIREVLLPPPPIGITSAPENIPEKMSEILVGVGGLIVNKDDSFVYGKDKKEHDKRFESHGSRSISRSQADQRKVSLWTGRTEVPWE